MSVDAEAAAAKTIRGPRAWWVLLALFVGLIGGMLAAKSGDGLREPLIQVASIVGTLWLNALKMTVIPLIVALLVTGIARTAEAARGGRIAAVSVAFFLGIFLCSAMLGAFFTPVLTGLFPLPSSAAEAMQAGLASIDPSATAAVVPKAQDFVRNIVPSNVIAAAANGDVLPLVVFTLLFALAVSQIGEAAAAQPGRPVRGHCRRLAGGDQLGAGDRADRRLGARLRARRQRRRRRLRGARLLYRAGVEPRPGRGARRLSAGGARGGQEARRLRPRHDRAAERGDLDPLVAGLAAGDAGGGAQPQDPRRGRRRDLADGRRLVPRHRPGDEPGGAVLHRRMDGAGAEPAARHRRHLRRRADEPQRRQPAGRDQLRQLDRADRHRAGDPARAAGVADRGRDGPRHLPHLRQCHHGRGGHRRRRPANRLRKLNAR